MIDHSQALTALIEHLSASEKSVNFGWHEVQQWQASARGFAGVVAGLLGFKSKPVHQKASALKSLS